NSLGCHCELAQHSGMIVADFFPQIGFDNFVRFVGSDGEIGSRHPINKIALQNRSVASDDSAPLAAREFFGVRQRSQDLVDGPVDAFPRHWREWSQKIGGRLTLSVLHELHGSSSVNRLRGKAIWIKKNRWPFAKNLQGAVVLSSKICD